MAAMDFVEVLKFNQNHGPDGRFASKNGGAPMGGLTKQPAAVTVGYTDTTSGTIINDYLRNHENENIPAQYKDTIARLDKAMQPTTSEMNLIRGVSHGFQSQLGLTDADGKKMSFEDFQKHVQGRTYTDKGYNSCTYAEKQQYGSWQLNIAVKPGTKALYTSNDKEQEVILGRNQTYKINSVRLEGHRFIFDVETVPEVAKSFDEILKFNPYHDSLGRFATANGATSMTYAPGKSKAHDLAIARLKAKEMVDRLSEEDKNEIRNLLNGGKSSEDPHESQTASSVKEEPKQQKYSREEQVEAIEDWTLSDYQEIRAAQCGNAKGSAEYQEKLRKKGEAIEEYISSNPSYEGEIYRGIYMDNPATPKVGQKLDMQGTSSWSADEYVAEHFAGAAERKTFSEHAYVFKMQKAPSQSADIDDISRNHGELEVLVSKNVQFRVTGVEKTNTHTVITVEEA